MIMTTSGAGAVFFLGTRAHYQVLQQPETRSFDTENGNTSTETIYPEPSQETQQRQNEINQLDYRQDNWSCDLSEVIVNDNDGNIEISTGMKRRSKRCASEITLCERDDDLKPAQLNNLDGCDPPKPRVWRARNSLTALLARLARRKNEPPSFRLHTALTQCSYREACRCLDCQSRYFECDESEGYSSDDSEYSRYLHEYQQNEMALAANEANYINGNPEDAEFDEEDDDEVFIDTVPGDNTSTDLLIDKPPAKPEMTSRYVDKMSISSSDDDGSLQLEVAAGTPALLNYLLTHPVTCAIQ